MLVPVDRSGPHIHLTAVDAKRLGVYNAKLAKPLRCAGNFTTEVKIAIVTDHAIGDFRLLWPFRDYSQVEMHTSLMERNGIPVFISTSGKHNGAPMVTAVYRDRAIRIPAIAVHQHLHAGPQDGLEDRAFYTVEINGLRPIILPRVKCYVAKGAVPVLHIDNDEWAAYGAPQCRITGLAA